MKTKWLIKKIGCIVYVRVPAMLKPNSWQIQLVDGTSNVDVLVLFMN
jgi:hypothetical protein